MHSCKVFRASLSIILKMYIKSTFCPAIQPPKKRLLWEPTEHCKHKRNFSPRPQTPLWITWLLPTNFKFNLWPVCFLSSPVRIIDSRESFPKQKCVRRFVGGASAPAGEPRVDGMRWRFVFGDGFCSVSHACLFDFVQTHVECCTPVLLSIWVLIPIHRRPTANANRDSERQARSADLWISLLFSLMHQECGNSAALMSIIFVFICGQSSKSQKEPALTFHYGQNQVRQRPG